MKASEEFLFFRDKLHEIFELYSNAEFDFEKEVAYKLGCLEMIAHDHYKKFKEKDEISERTEK